MPNRDSLQIKLMGPRSFVLEVIADLERLYKVTEVSRFKENLGSPGVHVYITISEAR